MAALPDMERATTMPARRFKEQPKGLSPVPSCEPSTYAAIEDAALPQVRRGLMERRPNGGAAAAKGSMDGWSRHFESNASHKKAGVNARGGAVGRHST